MRFGRKSDASGSGEEPKASETETTPAAGPFDASEVDLDAHEGVDLGSLVVTPVGAVELQLQVDEQSGEVIAVVLVGEHGALELRAFAASRG
ncbi:MAG: hypothetical protein JWQ67_2766, partial [Marmoricola sp.]|nr:hypothetical protein [Marmoricola sp.]